LRDGTENAGSVFWTALAGPAGIFAGMAKTQKRLERFLDSFS